MSTSPQGPGVHGPLSLCHGIAGDGGGSLASRCASSTALMDDQVVPGCSEAVARTRESFTFADAPHFLAQMGYDVLLVTCPDLKDPSTDSRWSANQRVVFVRTTTMNGFLNASSCMQRGSGGEGRGKRSIMWGAREER